VNENDFQLVLLSLLDKGEYLAFFRRFFSKCNQPFRFTLLR